MKTYTLKIVAIKKETDDTITISFKQPALKKIKYIAGEYITLILKINGRRYIRPYSFSSTTNVDTHLEITVKRVPNGIVSNYINDYLKIDDVVEVMPPMGNFVLPENHNHESVFLWGAGSGITPLISIAKYILYLKSYTKVNLIYGNKNLNTTIFYDLIEQLGLDFPERFKVWHFHSELTQNENTGIIKGRVNPELIIDKFTKNELSNGLHFICGPSGLKKSVKEFLKILQINENQILSEDFELIKSPEDFKEIEDRNIRIRFQNTEHNIEVPKGKSILEAALDNEIELPYSCQTGSCSTCKAILQSGEVKMIGLTENREDLHNNEYLLCCSHPLNNEVYLEI
ncbi:flavin reductase family protein [Pedobacter puniceum]|uniref:2Fe-2S iron-sulfur cluster binding domain-containing protein n=1 Tax=Pedobacter puniceum TaxID=2666136 RepID=A0A7K0FRL6_9SPHI|nr:iron-sulfur cluster-binding domain-containing protein [Pedobacter puniceum]MRX48649.1 2Fe-2S iron-sulfur cluster binding domain-containing protein [Pedobacter puniceum]